MSIFDSLHLVCPACSKAFDYEAVHSVNADRRADLRRAIVDGSFQQVDCPSCRTRFRLDPSFNYLDIRNGLWIAAESVTGLVDWKAREDNARALFERAYGADASAMAQEIGTALRPRVTFGWPALREKIVAAENGLDDIAVEACKAAAMRAQTELQFSAEADLRLIDVKDGKLLLAWVNPADNSVGEIVAVPKSLHDEIVADEEGDWSDFKRDYEGALFVDLNRLLVSQPA
ncbi:MAG: CpXC domain-containing protein [Caldimonas sp.]